MLLGLGNSMIVIHQKLKLSLLFMLFIFIVNMANAEQFEIHGFISQGLIKNIDTNFVNEHQHYSFDLTEVGVNGAYQLSSNVRVTGQLVYLNGGNRYEEGLRLDYLLFNWNFYNSESWQHHFYFGRIKNYHWLYSSTRDVPMTRPSIILPQSIYFDGMRDMSVGGDGIAFSTKYSNERLGEFDFNISSAVSSLSLSETQVIIGDTSTGDVDYERDLQASLYWQPSSSSWRYGFAMTDADFNYTSGVGDTFTDGRILLDRFYLNAEYFSENWIFSTELLQERMRQYGVYLPLFERDVIGRGGFVQLQFKPNKQWQVLTRYERFFADRDDKSGQGLELDSARLITVLPYQLNYDKIPHYYAYQHDFTLGLDYQLSHQLKLQIEHHWIQGTARLTPLFSPDPVSNNREHWQVSAVQLTYWF